MVDKIAVPFDIGWGEEGYERPTQRREQSTWLSDHQGNGWHCTENGDWSLFGLGTGLGIDDCF